MKKLGPSFTVFFFLILFISCKREYQNTGINPLLITVDYGYNNVSITFLYNNNRILDKIEMNEGDYSGTLDIFYHNNKVTSLRYFGYNEEGDYEGNYPISYSGNTMYIPTDEDETEEDGLTFYYDNYGKINKVSWGEKLEIGDYEYGEDLLDWSDNNVVTLTNNSEYRFSGDTYSQTNNTTFQYDGKKNPYSLLETEIQAILIWLDVQEDWYHPYLADYFSKSNVVKEIGNNESSLEKKYTYNSDGYLESIEVPASDWYPDVTISFEYK